MHSVHITACSPSHPFGPSRLMCQSRLPVVRRPRRCIVLLLLSCAMYAVLNPEHRDRIAAAETACGLAPLACLAVAGRAPKDTGCDRTEKVALPDSDSLRPIRAIAGVESLYDNQSISTFALLRMYQKTSPKKAAKPTRQQPPQQQAQASKDKTNSSGQSKQNQQAQPPQKSEQPERSAQPRQPKQPKHTQHIQQAQRKVNDSEALRNVSNGECRLRQSVDIGGLDVSNAKAAKAAVSNTLQLRF